MNKKIQSLKDILLFLALIFLFSFIISFIDGFMVSAINEFTRFYALHHPGSVGTHFKSHPIITIIITILISRYIFVKIKNKKKIDILPD